MNPQLAYTIATTRQQDLQRAAESYRANVDVTTAHGFSLRTGLTKLAAALTPSRPAAGPSRTVGSASA